MNAKPRYSTTGIALLLIGLSLAITLTLTASQPARANPGILYAAPMAQGSGDCSSWDNACTLQTALANAESGDEIWVKMGVYYPGAAGNRTATFTLKNGVALYGGFAGTENNRNERNWQTNVTVLSGDIDRNDLTAPNGVVTTTAHISGANSYHVISNTNVISTAVLDGFVVTAGQANGLVPDNSGGGMFNSSSSPTLTDITFIGNSAQYDGGGMYNYSSSPRLTNVTFTSNTAMQNGGGMSNVKQSSPTLMNTTLINNTAVQSGGGMYNWSSSPMLTGTEFVSNTAAAGGGMYNNGSNPVLTNTMFISNTATVHGGGMYNSGGTPGPSLINVTFRSNSATGDGGGMLNDHSAPTLTNIAFYNNTAGYNGGGVVNSYSNSALTNVIFSGNKAIGTLDYTGLGGGMFNYQSSPTLVNVTFGNNAAPRGGGGLYNWEHSNPTLTNVIIWHNSTDIGNGSSSNPTISYSDIRGCGGSSSWNTNCGTDSSGNIDADPLFVNATAGNLHLGPGSPCIDTGDNNAIPAGITTDLDGNPRIVDGNDDGSADVDMGAYEARIWRVFLPLVLRNTP